jgi:hypothetical protein
VLLIGNLQICKPDTERTETAFFKHVSARYYQRSIGFSYWRGKKGHEVDIIADVERRLVPFEVKYRAQKTGAADLKGLTEFCGERKISLGYAITKAIADFSVLELGNAGPTTTRLKIPAPLACYWLGQSEMQGSEDGGK